MNKQHGISTACIAFLASAIALLFSGTAVASDAYLCIADLSTGFSFNKDTGEWHRANFAAGEKYVLSKAKEGEWVVMKMGQDHPLLRCPGDFNAGNNLICSDGINDFRMNRHLLRYLRAFLIGYYVDYSDLKGLPGIPAMKEGGDTPELEIGKCAPI